MRSRAPCATSSGAISPSSRRPAGRHRLAALVLGLSLAGCGGGGLLAGVPAAKPHAGRASGLGEARFNRLDAVFVASLPQDALLHPGSLSSAAIAAKARAAAGPLRIACTALDPGDALLGPIRRACLARLDSGHVRLPTCPPPPLPKARANENVFSGGSTCPAAGAVLQAGLATARRLGRLADRAVDAAAIATACKGALRRPAAADIIDGDYIGFYALLSHRTPAGSQPDVAAELRILDAADRAKAQLPTYRHLLERFRAACA